MVLKFKPMEFMIGNIEIREICIIGDGAEIDEVKAYIDNVQIDVNDEEIFTDEVWDLICDKIHECLCVIGGFDDFIDRLIENEIHLPGELMEFVDVENYQELSKLSNDELKNITSDNYMDTLKSFNLM